MSLKSISEGRHARYRSAEDLHQAFSKVQYEISSHPYSVIFDRFASLTEACNVDAEVLKVLPPSALKVLLEFAAAQESSQSPISLLLAASKYLDDKDLRRVFASVFLKWEEDIEEALLIELACSVVLADKRQGCVSLRADITQKIFALAAQSGRMPVINRIAKESIFGLRSDVAELIGKHVEDIEHEGRIKFLIGSRKISWPGFCLWTKHAGSSEKFGYKLYGESNSNLIEIKKEHNVSVGTVIEIEISSSTEVNLDLERKASLNKNTDWYCWNMPIVVRRVVDENKNSRKVLEPKNHQSIWNYEDHPEISRISSDGYEAIYWWFSSKSILDCNGIKVHDPRPENFSSLFDSNMQFNWPLESSRIKRPSLSIVDRNAKLPLNLQRYELVSKDVPFASDLEQDVLYSFIAHALVCAPHSQCDALLFNDSYPLVNKSKLYSSMNFLSDDLYSDIDSLMENVDQSKALRWVINSKGMVPYDQYLLKYMGKKIVFFGNMMEFGYDLRIDFRNLIKMLLSVFPTENFAFVFLKTYFVKIDQDYDGEFSFSTCVYTSQLFDENRLNSFSRINKSHFIKWTSYMVDQEKIDGWISNYGMSQEDIPKSFSK